MGRTRSEKENGFSALIEKSSVSPSVSKVLGWPKRRKLAHAFLWEYSYKRLKLAQLLGQLGVFLTCVFRIFASRSISPTFASSAAPTAVEKPRSPLGLVGWSAGQLAESGAGGAQAATNTSTSRANARTPRLSAGRWLVLQPVPVVVRCSEGYGLWR